MDHLKRALHTLESAHTELARAVALERARGTSWASIGEQLGVTRQAAFKRFGTITKISTGKTVTPRSTSHLTTLTEKFLTLISQGEKEIVSAMMHPTTRRELPWENIAKVWDNCLSEYGQLSGFEHSHVTLQGTITPIDHPETVQIAAALGTVVGATTLHLEAGELLARVAFDHNDRVIGVLYLPVDTEASALPF